MSDPLEVELQIVVNCSLLVLGPKLGSSARDVQFLSAEPLSRLPTPTFSFLRLAASVYHLPPSPIWKCAAPCLALHYSYALPYLCVCVCVHACVEVRGQLSGADFLLAAHVFQGLNPGY